MLIKILGVAICTVIVGVFLKQYKPEYSLLANVCGGLIVFLIVIDGAGEIINSFLDIEQMTSGNAEIVAPILKVVGIGYITEFTSDLAEDCGNKSMADKVVLGGKVAICLLAVPIIKTLISAITYLI